MILPSAMRATSTRDSSSKRLSNTVNRVFLWLFHFKQNCWSSPILFSKVGRRFYFQVKNVFRVYFILCIALQYNEWMFSNFSLSFFFKINLVVKDTSVRSETRLVSEISHDVSVLSSSSHPSDNLLLQYLPLPLPLSLALRLRFIHQQPASQPVSHHQHHNTHPNTQKHSP